MTKCKCNKYLYHSLLGAVKACVQMKTKYKQEFYHYKCSNGYHITRKRNNYSGLITSDAK